MRVLVAKHPCHAPRNAGAVAIRVELVLMEMMTNELCSHCSEMAGRLDGQHGQLFVL